MTDSTAAPAITAGKIGHGEKVHRVFPMTDRFGGTYLMTSCGGDQHRGGSREHSAVRKIEGGIDAITCGRCAKSAQSFLDFHRGASA